MFVVEKPHPIYWAHISMLMADIRCLDLLLQSDASRLYQWQYFINQPGTALPIMKVDKIAALLGKYKGHCDAVVRLPGKKCPMDSIFTIRDTLKDERYIYKFELG